MDANYSPPSSSNSTAAAPQNLRQLPIYEYFQMCLFAQKILNQKYHVVLDMSHKALYTKSQNMNLDFSQFYIWIQDEVQKVIKE